MAVATLAAAWSIPYRAAAGPATAAKLSFPEGVAITPYGGYVIADSTNYRIRRVDAAGRIATIAGNGQTGFSGDGGPAILAQINPKDVAVDALGTVYIADTNNHRIRRVLDGRIDTVAGRGAEGFAGDGGPATAAKLRFPEGLAVDAAGVLYIADTYNNKIRRVDASGVITTIAGTGAAAFSGDGGPATQAALNSPYDIDVASDGRILIADAGNNRVRMIDPSGVITTIAGNGFTGFAGDGFPATMASLWRPGAVAFGPNGVVLIGDSLNMRVREVVTDGTIRTIAGSGLPASFGDGLPATLAGILRPEGIDYRAGRLLIADYRGHRIRLVEAAGVISTIAGTGTPGFGGDD